MWKIKRMMVWLGRIHRCRGFGVQSPWAYRLVRNVINERYPYYAYAQLAVAHPHADAVTRKLCDLCLRLANYVQPRRTVCVGARDAAFEAYVKAGCKRTDWQDITCECDVDIATGADFALLFPSPLASAGLKVMADGAKDGSMAVLIGIHENSDMKLLWRECRRNVKDVVLFDLYYCGLVCFDRKRYKQEYVINF